MIADVTSGLSQWWAPGLAFAAGVDGPVRGAPAVPDPDPARPGRRAAPGDGLRRGVDAVPGAGPGRHPDPGRQPGERVPGRCAPVRVLARPGPAVPADRTGGEAPAGRAAVREAELPLVRRNLGRRDGGDS